MTEIVTQARSSSNAVRTHAFPVLEAGNLSFPEGRYALAFEPGKDRSSFVLRHRVEGAPLISRLIAEGAANYLCAVSSPISSYRRTYLSSDPSQRISWDTDDLGEPPLFTPMIVSVSCFDLTLDQIRDGVHDIWHDRSVSVVKGDRIALGRVVQLKSSILHLLSFHADRNLTGGTFFVDAEAEQGFRFRVNLDPRLHSFLKYAAKNRIRENIMTHIVAACLALLQREFRDDDDVDGGWRSHRNLRALADFLDSKNLPHWSDDDFRPERVATSLYPHALPPDQNGEDA